MTTNENTHRFSAHQPISDMTLLLWKLGSICIDHMETLLYGTDYKHGYLFDPNLGKEISKDQRDGLLSAMIDVLQELNISQDEVIAAWNETKRDREESKEWGKQWTKEQSCISESTGTS